MAFTSTTQQLCGKSVSVPLLLLAAALWATPSEGGILTEVGGLSPFGLGVSDDAFHAAIDDEGCDAPALNLLHHKATYVKKALKKEVLVSDTMSETDSKSQSQGSARTVKLPFFSQKTPKLAEGVVLAQSESKLRTVKLPFFSQKTPKLAEGMVLAQSESRADTTKLPFFSQKTPKLAEGMVLAQSESRARTVKLPFFSEKTPKLQENLQKPRKMELPKDLVAESFDGEMEHAVALFQTDAHYKVAHRKPAHTSSFAFGPEECSIA